MIVVVALRGGVLARQHSRLWSMNSRFSEWTHDFDAARRLNIHPARPNKGKEDGRRLSIRGWPVKEEVRSKPRTCGEGRMK